MLKAKEGCAIGWDRSDTRYAVATSLAIGVAVWLTLGAFGLGPSPLPRLSSDPAPRLAGLAFEDITPPTTPATSVLQSVLQPIPADGSTGAAGGATGPPAIPTPPTAAFTTADGALLVGVPGPAQIEGTASDDDAVSAVRVSFAATGRAPALVEAVVSCTGSTCTWLADAPGPGTFDVSVVAFDADGTPSTGSATITVTVIQPASDQTDDLVDLVTQLSSLVGLG